jgi:hypothetical protein
MRTGPGPTDSGSSRKPLTGSLQNATSERGGPGTPTTLRLDLEEAIDNGDLADTIVARMLVDALEGVEYLQPSEKYNFQFASAAVVEAQRNYDSASSVFGFNQGAADEELAKSAGIVCALLGRMLTGGNPLRQLVLLFLRIILRDNPMAPPPGDDGFDLYEASLKNAAEVREVLMRRAEERPE